VTDEQWKELLPLATALANAKLNFNDWCSTNTLEEIRAGAELNAASRAFDVALQAMGL